MSVGFQIGTPGFMLDLPNAQGKLTMADGPTVSVSTFLGGGRFASVSPASRRAWSVSVPVMTPQEVARLQMLLRAVPAPYAWLSVWARSVNAITPDQALAFPHRSTELSSVGGLVECAGGILAPSLLIPAGGLTTLAQGIPVSSGDVVTGSAFARRAASTAVTVWVRFLNASGVSLITQGTTLATGGVGPLERIAHTATAPEGSVTATLMVSNAGSVAAPALTFSSEAMPWGVGDGCLSAVVEGLSIEPSVIATNSSGDTLADVSFTVTEVG